MLKFKSPKLNMVDGKEKFRCRHTIPAEIQMLLQ